ncbi:MAG: HD domain-containing phosphohydrolase [Nitrospirota bacterium]
MVPPLTLNKEEKPSILVVDDMQSNLELMEAIFQQAGYIVYKALGASAALDIYHKYQVDIAILDVMMPGVNGFELCKKLKCITSKQFFPIILLTALSDTKSRITGLESGADDFISKPFDTLELITKIKSLLKLKELYEELDHSENIILTLVVAMEARDPYTKGHSTRVGTLSTEFASFLGFAGKDQKLMKKAGILHDIGKIGLSESILRKPGRLTEDEANAIKKHTLIGEDICRPLLSLQGILPAIRSHHERWDGTGFPDNLAGAEIPLIARTLSILDSFDAMVSIRPYRDKRTIENALKTMEDERHSGQWDPELTGMFLKMMHLISQKGFQHV